jgi:hypothetical protein
MCYVQLKREEIVLRNSEIQLTKEENQKENTVISFINPSRKQRYCQF